MMDKRTIWVVVACMLALFGWQLVVSKFFPPKPLPLKPASQTIGTNAAPAQTAISSAVTNAAAAASPSPANAGAPLPPEQVVDLSNEFVRVAFTSWGGGVRSVELLKYKSVNGGNVILNGDGAVPALALVDPADTNSAYELQQSSPTSIVMRARLSSGATVVKQISLGAAYLLSGDVRISGASVSATATQGAAFAVGTVSPTAGREAQQVYLGVDWFAGGKYQNRPLKQLWKNAGQNMFSEPVDAKWAAVKSQFFTMIFTPGTDALAVDYLPLHLPAPAGWSGKTPSDGLSAAVLMPPMSLTNGVAEYAFTYYAGPKEYDRLVALGGGQEDVMQFGFWGVISVVLLKSMKFFHGVVPNYGVDIIVITVLIKLFFWPIQAKSIRSMREMQKFQPLMNKLKEKYKDDPQRLNQEMMKMYKEHKINPFSGCLPMVVQLPVLFAFYRMLGSAVELRSASFLWIHDLSLPDTVAHIGTLPVNILPILMLGSSVWQMKLTPQTGDQQQQKMMMFMPVMMIFIFYRLASGLLLYYTVQQILSVAQQWWMLKHAKASPPAGKALPAGKSR
jgi:YidC/Oxa1 family membrane protein insertase